MGKLSAIKQIPEPRREFFENDAAYRYFLDLTRVLKELQVGAADDVGGFADVKIGKTIGDVPQYEDDGSSNPVLDHPNMPLVGGQPVGVFGHALLHVQDQKAAGTNGGDFTNGAHRTRDLNTVLTNEINGASLASNVITLPVGNYWIQAIAPAYKAGRHELELFSNTDVSVFFRSISNYADSVSNVQTLAILAGRFTLSQQSDLIIRHRCQISKAVDGMGVETGSQWTVTHELYTDVRIWKIK